MNWTENSRILCSLPGQITDSSTSRSQWAHIHLIEIYWDSFFSNWRGAYKNVPNNNIFNGNKAKEIKIRTSVNHNKFLTRSRKNPIKVFLFYMDSSLHYFWMINMTFYPTFYNQIKWSNALTLFINFPWDVVSTYVLYGLSDY